ncbi:hypothetical protein ACYCOL_26595, partial [Klebsiella pneumoniae]
AKTICDHLAVRGVLFYFRMVSGRWLWKYPRVKASSEES